MTPSPLRCAAAALLALPLASLLPAQQTKVLPRGMDFVEAPLVYTYPFGRADAAIQLLYNADQVTLGQGVLFGMRFRQSQVTAAQTHPGYTKNYRVTAYTVAANAASMSPDPAVNIGAATGTVVFQGPVVLPPIAPLTTQPAPFAIHVPFTQPYAFDGSQGNLLLLVETADLAAVPAGSYRIDAVNFPTTSISGLVAGIDTQGCVANGQSLALATDAAAAIVGGSITQTLTPSVAGAFPVAMTGLAFDLAPLDLTAAGLPGCTSWLGNPVFQFAVAGPTGFAPVVWSLPLDPSLEGVAVAGQALGIASSGLLGDCATSNAVAARIGSNSTPVRTMGMSFRGTTGWAMGSNGTFIAVVAFEGVFP